MSLGIKKGDKVIVTSGKDRGKSGKVLRIVSSNKRIVVEGVNLVKKHIRRRSESETGGIKEVPASVHISNVSLFCPNCNTGVKFGIKASRDKSKARVCKRCRRAI